MLFALVTLATSAQERQAPRERPIRDQEFSRERPTRDSQSTGERPSREQITERQLTMLTEKLSLTPEQQQKNEGLSQRIETARRSNNRDEMRVYQLQHKAEIKKILTPEQKVIYEELEKENQQRWNPREERGEESRPRKPRRDAQ